MKQNLILAGIVLVLIAAIGGAYFFPVQSNQQAVGSPTGSSFSTAKYAGETVNLASPGANGTSTSILNTDTSDRFISALRAGCEVVGTSRTAYTGAGLASLTVTVATTSTAEPATLPSTANTVGGAAFTIATSTPNFGIASSTMSTGVSTTSIIWAANSYLTFVTNATNTALCTFGVDYIGS